MKIVLLAGEISGDHIGSIIASELYKTIPHIKLLGITGDRMKNAGIRSLADIDELSVVGLGEVIYQLPRLLAFRRKIFKQIVVENPDFVIGIDAPDFNLGLLAKLRRKGLRTFQLVAPTVWAWRKWRINQIRKSVEKVLCLYPFEVDFFNQYKIPTIFVGHPLADTIPIDYHQDQFRKQMKIDNQKLIIALLPGSRESEIIRHSKLLIETAKIIDQELNPLNPLKKQNEDTVRRTPRIISNFESLIPNDPNETLTFFNQSPVQYIVPLPTIKTYNLFKELTRKELASLPIRIMRGHAKQAIAASDICILSSGTASLEAALYKKPMVIFYKLNSFTQKLVRFLYKIPWFGLPNILTQKSIVPEFLQNQATEFEIANAAISLLEDRDRCKKIIEEFKLLHQSLIVARNQIWKQLFFDK